jgi:predicted proteasome-type protease
MTLRLGIVTDEGPAMDSDSRSNAGFDPVNMRRFVQEGERVFVIRGRVRTQSVRYPSGRSRAA